MICNDARMLMSRSLDGELDPPEVEELRRHIEACPDCAGYERRMLAIDDLMDSLPRPGPRRTMRPR